MVKDTGETNHACGLYRSSGRMEDDRRLQPEWYTGQS